MNNNPAWTPWDAECATKKKDQVITLTRKRGKLWLEFKKCPWKSERVAMKEAGYRYAYSKNAWYAPETYTSTVAALRLRGALKIEDARLIEDIKFTVWQRKAPWSEIFKTADDINKKAPVKDTDKLLMDVAREYYEKAKSEARL